MITGRLAEWLIALVLKTSMGQPIIGSNPISSATDLSSQGIFIYGNYYNSNCRRNANRINLLGWRMFQRGNAEAIESSKTKKTS